MPPANPTEFSCLLQQHLRRGTRPDGMPGRLGRQWTTEEFAQAVGRPAATVSVWRNGARHPINTTLIEKALFGCNKIYDNERVALRCAHQAARPRVKPARPEVVVIPDDLIMQYSNEISPERIGSILRNGDKTSYERGLLGLRRGNTISIQMRTCKPEKWSEKDPPKIFIFEAIGTSAVLDLYNLFK